MLTNMTMSQVGEQLHAAREALKLTVQQIADTTKIRTDHIRALEEGHFEVFSAPVYIRGFVRIYATQLKLNTAQIMSALDAELKQTEKFKEPPPLMEESNTLLDHAMFWLSKLNWRVGVIAGGALVLLLVLLFAGFGLAASCAQQSAGRLETRSLSIGRCRRNIAADDAPIKCRRRMTNRASCSRFLSAFCLLHSAFAVHMSFM